MTLVELASKHQCLSHQMAPRMKDSMQNEGLSTPEDVNPVDADFNFVKAFLQFSMQITGEHKEHLDIRDFLRRRSKDSSKDSLLPKISTSSSSSSSPDAAKEHSLLSFPRRWRKPSLIRRRRHSKDESKESASPQIKFPPDMMVEGMAGHEQFSMQQTLALTALDLSAPACSTSLRRNTFVQLSGHPGSLAPAGPGTIWKKQPGETTEAWVYEALMHDVAKDVVPKFYKEIEYEGERFIEISDLLSGFHNPSMMDIKMGTRTFLESEATNNKARSDLYEKMIKVDPNAPTPEEHASQSIVKLRYMDFRDQLSSSRKLGFRIDALKMNSNKSVTALKTVREKEEIVDTIYDFIQGRESTKKQILRSLNKIKDRFQNSKFFQSHEVIGSSILIVYDDDHANAWIIDFAKTNKLSDDISVNHKDEWVMGNHEEGYLSGIDNLISCMQQVPVVKSRRLSFFRRL